MESVRRPVQSDAEGLEGWCHVEILSVKFYEMEMRRIEVLILKYD